MEEELEAEIQRTAVDLGTQLGKSEGLAPTVPDNRMIRDLSSAFCQMHIFRYSKSTYSRHFQ